MIYLKKIAHPPIIDLATEIQVQKAKLSLNELVYSRIEEFKSKNLPSTFETIQQAIKVILDARLDWLQNNTNSFPGIDIQRLSEARCLKYINEFYRHLLNHQTQTLCQQLGLSDYPPDALYTHIRESLDLSPHDLYQILDITTHYLDFLSKEFNNLLLIETLSAMKFNTEVCDLLDTNFDVVREYLLTQGFQLDQISTFINCLIECFKTPFTKAHGTITLGAPTSEAPTLDPTPAGLTSPKTPLSPANKTPLLPGISKDWLDILVEFFNCTNVDELLVQLRSQESDTTRTEYDIIIDAIACYIDYFQETLPRTLVHLESATKVTVREKIESVPNAKDQLLCISPTSDITNFEQAYTHFLTIKEALTTLKRNYLDTLPSPSDPGYPSALLALNLSGINLNQIQGDCQLYVSRLDDFVQSLSADAQSQKPTLRSPLSVEDVDIALAPDIDEDSDFELTDVSSDRIRFFSWSRHLPDEATFSTWTTLALFQIPVNRSGLEPKQTAHITSFLTKSLKAFELDQGFVDNSMITDKLPIPNAQLSAMLVSLSLYISWYQQPPQEFLSTIQIFLLLCSKQLPNPEHHILFNYCVQHIQDVPELISRFLHQETDREDCFTTAQSFVQTKQYEGLKRFNPEDIALGMITRTFGASSQQIVDVTPSTNRAEFKALAPPNSLQAPNQKTNIDSITRAKLQAKDWNIVLNKLKAPKTTQFTLMCILSGFIVKGFIPVDSEDCDSSNGWIAFLKNITRQPTPQPGTDALTHTVVVAMARIILNSISRQDKRTTNVELLGRGLSTVQLKLPKTSQDFRRRVHEEAGSLHTQAPAFINHFNRTNYANFINLALAIILHTQEQPNADLPKFKFRPIPVTSLQLSSTNDLHPFQVLKLYYATDQFEHMNLGLPMIQQIFENNLEQAFKFSTLFQDDGMYFLSAIYNFLLFRAIENLPPDNAKKTWEYAVAHDLATGFSSLVSPKSTPQFIQNLTKASQQILQSLGIRTNQMPIFFQIISHILNIPNTSPSVTNPTGYGKTTIIEMVGLAIQNAIPSAPNLYAYCCPYPIQKGGWIRFSELKTDEKLFKNGLYVSLTPDEIPEFEQWCENQQKKGYIFADEGDQYMRKIPPTLRSGIIFISATLNSPALKIYEYILAGLDLKPDDDLLKLREEFLTLEQKLTERSSTVFSQHATIINDNDCPDTDKLTQCLATPSTYQKRFVICPNLSGKNLEDVIQTLPPLPRNRVIVFLDKDGIHKKATSEGISIFNLYEETLDEFEHIDCVYGPDSVGGDKRKASEYVQGQTEAIFIFDAATLTSKDSEQNTGRVRNATVENWATLPTTCYVRNLDPFRTLSAQLLENLQDSYHSEVTVLLNTKATQQHETYVQRFCLAFKEMVSDIPEAVSLLSNETIQAIVKSIPYNPNGSRQELDFTILAHLKHTLLGSDLTGMPLKRQSQLRTTYSKYFDQNFEQGLANSSDFLSILEALDTIVKEIPETFKPSNIRTEFNKIFSPANLKQPIECWKALFKQLSDTVPRHLPNFSRFMLALDPTGRNHQLEIPVIRELEISSSQETGFLDRWTLNLESDLTRGILSDMILPKLEPGVQAEFMELTHKIPLSADELKQLLSRHQKYVTTSDGFMTTADLYEWIFKCISPNPPRKELKPHFIQVLSLLNPMQLGSDPKDYAGETADSLKENWLIDPILKQRLFDVYQKCNYPIGLSKSQLKAIPYRFQLTLPDIIHCQGWKLDGNPLIKSRAEFLEALFNTITQSLKKSTSTQSVNNSTIAKHESLLKQAFITMLDMSQKTKIQFSGYSIKGNTNDKPFCSLLTDNWEFLPPQDTVSFVLNIAIDLIKVLPSLHFMPQTTRQPQFDDDDLCTLDTFSPTSTDSGSPSTPPPTVAVQIPHLTLSKAPTVLATDQVPLTARKAQSRKPSVTIQLNTLPPETESELDKLSTQVRDLQLAGNNIMSTIQVIRQAC